MGYVDMAVGFGIFILFLAFILVQAINYFSGVPLVARIAEFRDKAIDFFDSVFKSDLTTEWEDFGETPKDLELKLDLYEIIVSVKETGNLTRTNESVTVSLIFDDYCKNKTWNNTIRVYDESENEVTSWLSDAVNCSNTQYLNQSDVIWKVNFTPSEINQTKKFWVYYSDDNTVSAPSYGSPVYDSDSWVPTDGDSWTESTNNWQKPAGVSGTVKLDSTNKKVGSYSINITEGFDSDNITELRYDDLSNNIINSDVISNDWYLRAWLLIDNTAILDYMKIDVKDASENNITEDILSYMSNNEWYPFEKKLSSWSGAPPFNASKGIDFVRFYARNNTATTITLKIDGLRFEKEPLQIKEFPAKKITAISSCKVKALRNYTYEQLKKAIGEDYKFMIEISNVTT